MKSVYVEMSDIITNDANGYHSMVGAPESMIPEDKRDKIRQKLLEDGFYSILPGTFIADYIALNPAVATHVKFVLSHNEAVAKQQLDWVGKVMFDKERNPIEIEVVKPADVPHNDDSLLVSSDRIDIVKHGAMGGQVLHFKGVSQLEFVLNCIITTARKQPLVLVNPQEEAK